MAILAYQLARTLKWILILGCVGYSLYFLSDRAPHIDQFGNLTLYTELILFVLPLVAMSVGLLQLCLWDYAYGGADKAEPLR
jgi:hypothetical protein